ncbi:Spo0B domain-containing protein [Salipaludibacillus neizhouensis]|uniref:Spo0B domain-containing protein n=1 Tax=Salipaludibacillus neizhouensis TaxID=885475 RepID=UPI000DA61A3B|nr:Spo0B domain-containing protein [Salipaludibacillus neizhouensis]
MATEWNVLNLLRHSRHDWLNHLQLINGYLSMGRVDKVEKLVEDIVNKAKNESHISHLKMDKVAEKLLTFNWGDHSFRISFEVITNESDWSQVEDTVYPFLEMLFQLLDTYAAFL